jgi:hypothetical protein
MTTKFESFALAFSFLWTSLLDKHRIEARFGLPSLVPEGFLHSDRVYAK